MSKGGSRWYRKEEYKQPREPFELADGSIVEIVPEAYKGHPFALKITRVWPDERVSTIYLDPPREGLKPGTDYLFVDDPRPRAQTEEFETALATGSYRPPYLQLSAVPGNKPGDDFDAATLQRFETRKRFNEYYKENHLEKVSPADSTLSMRGAGGAYSGNAQQFDPAKPPPVPEQFRGVPFHSVDTMSQANSILRG